MRLSRTAKWGSACTLIFCLCAFAFTEAGPDGAAVNSRAAGAGLATSPAAPYSVDKVKRPDGATEYRFYHKTHHFLTAESSDSVLSIRPHPGVDPNGWGSTWYPQPFIAFATLGHTRILKASAGTLGVSLSASGRVSRGESSTYGNWRLWMHFRYLEAEKKILGSGSDLILLAGSLGDANEDLNICKIASSYLDDVPLLSGGFGDTGDMAAAEVVAPEFQFTWNPSLQPGHFPQDTTDRLSIDVLGQYNNVDTAAQGYEPIAAAYKPSLKLMLASRFRAVGMIFGGMYDTGKSTHFWEDNVGITPLVLKRSTRRLFSFAVTFESQALPGDGT